MEKPESEERGSDQGSSSEQALCHRNPLLMSKSQVSMQFGKTIRNANVSNPNSTIKNVKDTLTQMTAPKKFLLEQKKKERAAKKEADLKAKE